MDDDTVELDIEKMTLGEIETIEEIAGADAVAGLMSGGRMTAKVLIAVTYVVKRRDNPAFTLDDARAMKVMALKQPDDAGKAPGNGG